jgi:hypothetical protein
MNALPNQCPICGGGITVTRFYCDECDVTIEGRFMVGKFAQLSNEQMQFVETFIRNEGKISRMEAELDLSYPTIRARLHDVIRKMGYEPGKDEASAPPPPKVSNEQRKRILDDLNSGRISAEQAMKMLNPVNTEE